jgi:hypothetical protein
MMNELESDTPQGQDNTTERGNEPKDGGTLGIVLFAQKNPATPSEQYCSYHSPKPPWWKRLSSWQLFIEILVFIVAIRVACIYSGQLKQMIEANRLSHDNFIVDERAWVGVDIQLSNTKNADGTIRFVANGVLKNTGKTPALKMSFPHNIVITRAWNETIDQDKEWAAGIESLKHAEEAGKQTMEANKNANPQFMAEFGSILANQREKWHGEGGALAPNSTSPVNLTNETMVDPSFKNGQPQILYWIGRFTYYDIFGKQQHTTKFCFRYAERSFEICPDGNSMD